MSKERRMEEEEHFCELVPAGLREARGEDPSILIVEDHPSTRKLLQMLLQKRGYEAIAVQNGKEALELFKERFFPIVLTDWIMPETDGRELCSRLRESRWDSYIYIIFLTARDSKNDVVQGLDAGADDYLTKPFNPAELAARIRTGIRILRLEGSLRKANEEIQLLTITDPLTGLYNRRYLYDRLPQEIKRSLRYGHSLSLILCDLDYFKRVNDTYGHQAGDTVLRVFGRLIKEGCRAGVDWTARYGGEEFVAVLPETEIGGAYLVAERLRQTLENEMILLEKSAIRVTASWGVTSLSSPQTEQTSWMDILIRQADDALTEAKREGRNRVKKRAMTEECLFVTP